MKENLLYCHYCAKHVETIWVHGHGQCPICKINIDECCRGEHCDEKIMKRKQNERN